MVFGIVVNKLARRFYDEGEDVWPKRYAIWGRLVAAEPDQLAYILLTRRAELLHAVAVSADPSRQHRRIAAKLDLDPDALAKTVAGFNAAVRPGTFDRTFSTIAEPRADPPKSHWARRIETPPFYAYPVRPGITFTYLGTRVDRQARMLMQDGGPTANMFAAGEIMAGNVLGRATRPASA